MPSRSYISMTSLSAILTQDYGKTNIACRFSLRPIMMFFMIFFGGSFALGMIHLFHDLVYPPATLSPSVAETVGVKGLPNSVINLLGFAVFIAGLAYSRFRARAEWRLLSNFVRQTLDATPVDGSYSISEEASF
jgi:hypothetical protein